MTDKHINNIAEIEDAQAGLRESIAATKELAERTDDLLQRHRARDERLSVNDDA
ncbi:hypothetical protein FHS95_003681 [Sphingomonas naasensis]|uniref:hypothetical protein n=1 Tax=Sphingomonas naasensis TaxID=1344951 RepID=UPI00141BB34D|nr:hypothetical protein [Sphingomonas naasensis]NIJ21970.1 hypothetical protein [Sphingomonas naasensis]